jgi:hypothetical protein
VEIRSLTDGIASERICNKAVLDTNCLKSTAARPATIHHYTAKSLEMMSNLGKRRAARDWFSLAAASNQTTDKKSKRHYLKHQGKQSTTAYGLVGLQGGNFQGH